MDYIQLKYIRALARCQNFSRAAEQLYITQSSLSQQLKKLEEEIGFTLFDRSPRHVLLTEQGAEFLSYAEKAIDEFENLERYVSGVQKAGSHRIIFGASQYVSPMIADVFPVFLQSHPNVDFKLIEAINQNLIEMVGKGEIDLAVVPLSKDIIESEQFQVKKIKREYVCAIMSTSHPLASRASISLEDLCDQQLIFSSVRAGLKKIVFKEFERKGLKHKEPFEITSELNRMPLLNSGAITFSLNEVNSWAAHEDIVRLPIVPQLYSEVSLILPRLTHITPEISDLMDLITDAMLKHQRIS